MLSQQWQLEKAPPPNVSDEHGGEADYQKVFELNRA